MKSNPILMKGGVIIIVTGILTAVHWQGVHHLASQHDASTVRRITRVSAGLLQQAHHAKDDLLIQQTMQAVALASGVSFAAVIDNQNKILAHSEPSQLGQTLHPKARFGTHVQPLKEGGQEWGKLAIGFSDPHFRQEVNREGLVYTFILLLAAFSLFGYLSMRERQNEATDGKITDLLMLLEEEKNRASRFEAKWQALARQSQEWLHAALGQQPRPMVFLDGQQRVFAMNDSAARLMQVSLPAAVVGKSWNEVSALISLGPVLEQSLQSPGVKVHAANNSYSLSTLQDQSGTWVLFESSPESVK